MKDYCKSDLFKSVIDHPAFSEHNSQIFLSTNLVGSSKKTSKKFCHVGLSSRHLEWPLVSKAHLSGTRPIAAPTYGVVGKKS